MEMGVVSAHRITPRLVEEDCVVCNFTTAVDPHPLDLAPHAASSKIGASWMEAGKTSGTASQPQIRLRRS